MLLELTIRTRLFWGVPFVREDLWYKRNVSCVRWLEHEVRYSPGVWFVNKADHEWQISARAFFYSINFPEFRAHQLLCTTRRSSRPGHSFSKCFQATLIFFPSVFCKASNCRLASSILSRPFLKSSSRVCQSNDCSSCIMLSVYLWLRRWYHTLIASSGLIAPLAMHRSQLWR